ncbi:MAG: hypothetical protein VKS61_15515 [Candidatus Sericytochromatia bacterium]|nr:hypothetical protein [Candidatus Sericytochromatia bacterium]
MAMRTFKLLLAVCTAWALTALPGVQADAHPAHGAHHAAGHAKKGHAAPKAGGDDCCKPAAKPAPKAGGDDCCKPAAKPAPKAGGDDCCKPAAKAGGDDCCKPAAKAGDACKDKAACGGACKDKAACGDACKDKAACAPKRRSSWGMKGHGPRAVAVSYLPAVGLSTQQHVLVSTTVTAPINRNFSLGRQMNMALQVPVNTANGPWLSTYGGVLPRLSTEVGPLNLQVGALLGGGAMFRTVSTTTPGNLVQANLFWAVHPQVKLAAAKDDLSGITLGYLLTSQQAELSGPTIGFQWSYKHGR